jgi:GAF domain-containing protein
VRAHVPGTDAERAIALRRAVARISASLELDEVFRDVVDAARELFAPDVAALWLLTPGLHPLRIAAHHGLPADMIAAGEATTRDDPILGRRAIDERRIIVLDRPETAPYFADLYAREGFRVVTFVPLVVRDEALGLLVLYHRTPHTWTPDELELCTTFASQMAIAVANAQLVNSVRAGAARLRAIQELSSRLNRIQEVEGIGAAIVAGADRLIGHDTIRVYRVDHVTQVCEPIAFQGEFAGIGTPSKELLRVGIGDGLTGWVALHNTTIRIGDAATDPRGRQVGESRGAESMLVVPMSYESRVLGIIVLSKAGYDQYTEDDQRTLEIFAGYAAQALVNAEASSRSCITAWRASAGCSRSTSASSRPSTPRASSRWSRTPSRSSWPTTRSRSTASIGTPGSGEPSSPATGSPS